MINEIREAFKENFDKLKWMDPATSLKAKKKADSIIDMIGTSINFSSLVYIIIEIILVIVRGFIFVGFPDYILDDNELNKKYDGLVITEDKYFQNNIRINKFKIKENLLKVDEPVNKTK